MLTRRDFVASAAFTLACGPLHSQTSASGLSSQLAALERSAGGRLGVAILDTQSNQRAGHREHERFAMCSTFKMLLSAAILRQIDTRHESLDATIAIPKAGLLAHSPITSQHAGQSMPIRDLCFAALTQSDNTAANLLVARLNGPAAVTAFARSIGDTVTRLDRIEPELNDTQPGEIRDTTSPAATLADLQSLLLGTALSSASRHQLTTWMIANTTGDERLRAGLPRTWRVADKTGSDGETTSNDIAALWPPNRAPILVTAYLTECPGPESHRSAALAQVARLIAATAETTR
jgi:beta-lactamase class A